MIGIGLIVLATVAMIIQHSMVKQLAGELAILEIVFFSDGDGAVVLYNLDAALGSNHFSDAAVWAAPAAGPFSVIFGIGLTGAVGHVLTAETRRDQCCDTVRLLPPDLGHVETQQFGLHLLRAFCQLFWHRIDRCGRSRLDGGSDLTRRDPCGNTVRLLPPDRGHVDRHPVVRRRCRPLRLERWCDRHRQRELHRRA